MQTIKSRQGLLNFYKSLPTDVQEYFDDLEGLLNGFSLDVVLAYVFSRVERAHVNSLYCGAVKFHHVDSGLARRAVRQFHMTRDGFRKKFAMIYPKGIPEETIKLLVVAEGVRDAVLHGKGGRPEHKRNAVAHVLEYANLLNEHCAGLNGPRPFGNLRGFKGAAQGLEKSTSRWVLLGMGFLIQKVGGDERIKLFLNPQ
jgi:hypothetical protein